jgi:Leucine-rich repeat (LRR) protein
MEDFIDNKMISKYVENQRDLLYLNFMPKGLQKLETYLMKMKEKNKIWKVRNTVQTIEAYQCKLDNIKVVSLFSKLQDLNIGGNPNLTSLAGVDHCTNLRYLNCSECDI